jgi:hypothetical protein
MKNVDIVNVIIKKEREKKKDEEKGLLQSETNV